MTKKILLTVAAMIASVAAVFSGVSPAAAASALPHWGPWMLCATSTGDYDVRVYVSAMTGSVRYPNGMASRKHSTAATPTYDAFKLEWFNGSGTFLDVGSYGVGARSGGYSFSFTGFPDWVGTANPQARITLYRNGAVVCQSNKVLVG